MKMFPFEKGEYHQCIPNPYEDKDNEFLNNFKVASSIDKFSDFTINCGDEKFPCHKVILAIRSVVFIGMFSRNTEEMIENKVSIKDSTTPIVKALLDFIYTGYCLF